MIIMRMLAKTQQKSKKLIETVSAMIKPAILAVCVHIQNTHGDENNLFLFYF